MTGQDVKRLRKARGLTLDDLQRISGVTTKILSEIENGLRDPQVTTLERILAAMGAHLSFAEGEAASLPWTVSPRTRTRKVIDRDAIIKRDKRICHLCGERVPEGERELHIDHIIPHARGGDDNPENLAVAHRACNQRKAARLL